MASLPTNNSGFSLIEVILSIALLALFITIFSDALIYAQENASLATKRTQAVFLLEEGYEAVRHMRDVDFTLLSDGAHGLSIVNNHWIFSGFSDQSDIFNRQIIISSINSVTKQISVQIQWPQTARRVGTISIVSYLTRWRENNSSAPL